MIRPIQGAEPFLYECLASTFEQNYPSSKLTVYFCLADRRDAALPTVEKVLQHYAQFDARLFVAEEDDLSELGPNPKIRNMSRAYQEAKGDLVWIVDCNVWVSASTASLMTDMLCGISGGRKFKFVHQLPLVVDVSNLESRGSASTLGSLFEEMFLSTSHAKFYTAISTVAVAPCTVGKSNMFRRSHLNCLTASHRSAGIDYFSHNICEDHLIGDLLWRSPVPRVIEDSAEQEGPASRTWGNHCLLRSPPCIQPLSASVETYAARRTRWLRVRKFTVPLATLVEPGTESLLATAYGAFGLTTLNWCHHSLGIPQTWRTFWALWLFGIVSWAAVDHWVWSMLQGWHGERGERNCPPFVGHGRRRGLGRWLRGWLGRELLAFPIWAWAIVGGTTVVWRGRKFWVGMDMRVHEVEGVERKKQ